MIEAKPCANGYCEGLEKFVSMVESGPHMQETVREVTKFQCAAEDVCVGERGARQLPEIRKALFGSVEIDTSHPSEGSE